MPPHPKPWFTDYFEVRAGVIRLCGSPNLSWANIADESLSGENSLLEISRRRGVSLEEIQACLALHAWTLTNPTADPLTLFAPAKPEGGGEQTSEFARAVAKTLAEWKEERDHAMDKGTAKATLADIFADTYKSLRHFDLMWLAAACELVAEDLNLKPDPESDDTDA